MLSYCPEDTRLLLSLVAVVSGGVVVMALLLILLHCRRRSRAKERTGAQETGKEDRSRAQEHEQEVWPGMEDTELTPEAKVRARAANEPLANFSQSRGRHLPGPTLGSKHLPALSHLRHYVKWVPLLS